jgi:hypothetical protein
VQKPGRRSADPVVVTTVATRRQVIQGVFHRGCGTACLVRFADLIGSVGVAGDGAAPAYTSGVSTLGVPHPGWQYVGSLRWSHAFQ